VSFIGSVKTGRNIAVDCAKLGKKSQLEMGGKNPMVVLDDANRDTAVSFSERRVFLHGINAALLPAALS